jgi:hypothetical protein
LQLQPTMTTKKASGRYNNNNKRSEPYQTRSNKNDRPSGNTRQRVITEAYDQHDKVRPSPPPVPTEAMDTDDNDIEDGQPETSSKNQRNNEGGRTSKGPRDSNGATEDTNQKEITENIDDDDREFINVNKPRGHKALGLLEKIPGKSNKQKEKFVARFYAECSGYAGTACQTVKNIRYIVLYFNTQDELVQAINTPLTVSDTESVKFTLFSEIVTKPTQLELLKIESSRVSSQNYPTYT